MDNLNPYRRLSFIGVALTLIVLATSLLGGPSADDRISVSEQRDAHAMSYVVVPVSAVADIGIDSVAFRMSYPAEWLTAVGVYKTAATREFALRFDVELPGHLMVELHSDDPLFGASEVVWILFRNTGASGDEASLTLSGVVVNGSESATLEHGWMALGGGSTTLSLPGDLVGNPGTMVTAPMIADPADGILALDIFIQFDSTVLQFDGANASPFAAGFSVTTNLLNPDLVKISQFGTVAPTGTGPMLELDFTVVGAAGSSSPLDIVSVSINEDAIEAMLVDGFFLACDGADVDGDGFSLCDLDCDDDDNMSFPGNPEVACDGRDNDCDTGTPDIVDADGDRFFCNEDCDDDNPDVNPGRPEVCDGVDNNCDMAIDNVPVPSESIAVLGNGAGTATFSWNTVSGADYDVVRGRLGVLLGTSGDFTQSTGACLADDTAMTAVDDTEIPSPGGGFWYIVRATHCGGDGTYDSGGAGQFGQRDAETNASPDACP